MVDASPSPREDAPKAASASGPAGAALGFFGTLAVVVLAASASGLLPGPRGFAYAGAALLASRAVWRVATAALGPSWGVAARGAGWGAAAFLALRPLEAPYSTAAPLAGLVLAGAFLVASDRGGSWRALAWTGAGVAALVAAQRFVAPFAADFPDLPAWRFTVLYLAAAATVLGTRIGRALRGERAGPVSAALTESEVRNLALAVPLVAYALFRGALAESLRHFEVYEWTLGVMLAAYVLAALRGRFRELVEEEPWRSEARRHAQAVVPRPDPTFSGAADAFEAFVERGEERGRYVAFWRETLARAGVSGDEASALLARAAAAPAPPAPRGGVPWRRRAADDEAALARDKRVEVHRALLARVVDRSEWSRHGGRKPRSARVQSHPR